MWYCWSMASKFFDTLPIRNGVYIPWIWVGFWLFQPGGYIRSIIMWFPTVYIVRNYEFYLVEYWIFLYFYRYSWICSWQGKLLGNSLIRSVLFLRSVTWSMAMFNLGLIVPNTEARPCWVPYPMPRISWVFLVWLTGTGAIPHPTSLFN